MRTPAKDGGYDFAVFVGVVWTGPLNMSEVALRRQIGHHEAEVWELIATEIRAVARCYPPNQPAQAEDRLADRLDCAAKEWRPTHSGGGGVTWRTRLSVEPDEHVKRLQQEFWAQRLQQDALVAFGREQVSELRDLVKGWRQFLGDLNVDDSSGKPPRYLAPYLARLAVEPGRAADTVAALAEHWAGQNDQLLEVVREAMSTHQDLNTYEFLTSYESALKLLLEYVGTVPAELGTPLVDRTRPPLTPQTTSR